MKRIMLESYAVKNLGDDLFLSEIAKRYKDNIFVLETGLPYCNVRTGRNIRYRFRLLYKIICHFFNTRHYRNYGCDAHLILGGSMFIEQENNEIDFKEDLFLRYDKNVPLFVIGSNFGPFVHKYYYDEYKKLFSNALDVCFRDNYSARLFCDLQNIRVAPDMLFGLDTSKYCAGEERKVVISVIDLGKRNDLVSYKERYEDKIIQIASYYAELGYEVVLMSFCKYEGDENAVKRIVKKVKHQNIRTHYYRGDFNKALEEISSSEIVIGTRFHSIVLGLDFEKKILPIVYSDKTKNMLEDINYQGRVLAIKDIDSLDVSRIDSYVSSYKGIDTLRKESQNHFKKLDEFLGRGD